MATAPTANRGEIWLISFDPAVGAEIRKARPAVVINLDAVGRLPLRLVAPVTDWKPQYGSFPWFIQLQPYASTGLIKPSGADAFQTKSVSVSRFVRLLGCLEPAKLEEIALAVAMCVGAP